MMKKESLKFNEAKTVGLLFNNKVILKLVFTSFCSNLHTHTRRCGIKVDPQMIINVGLYNTFSQTELQEN